MGWERIVNDVDDPLFRLAVGVSDKINDLLMFNAKAGARTFCQNHSGLASRVGGHRKERFKRDILVIRQGHVTAS